MDVREKGWFGQLTVSGKSAPINDSGSIMELQAKFTRELMTLNPRELKNGKAVTIQFAQQPFSELKAEDDLTSQSRRFRHSSTRR